MTDPLTVPTTAGMFSAFLVAEGWPDGSSQHLHFAPAVDNDVRTESFASDESLTAVTSLAAYRYQALETPTFPRSRCSSGPLWSLSQPPLSS
jgi:hypothetical protein